MLLEAEFWVAVAFVIFMGIAWKAGAFTTMTKGLDGRATRIRHELDEAKRAAEEGHRKLDDFLARRTKAAETKIAQAEVQAEAQVRAAAADAAVKVSETILRERLQGDAAQGLIRASLGEVRTRLRS